MTSDPHRLRKIRSIRSTEELRGFWAGVRAQKALGVEIELTREDYEALEAKAREFSDKKAPRE